VTDRCTVPRCRRDVEIVYLGRAMCWHHWDELAAEEPAAMEEPMESMNETVSENSTETKPAAQSAEEEETAMPPKKTAKKKIDAKPSKKAHTSKAAKLAKAPKAKKETGPKPSRTFAIRITDAELAAIHRAAGPRNATRFIRQVAAAFANGDEGAFKAVVKEAREARQ